MGITSSSVSITQYRVEGKPAAPVLETVAAGLQQHAIAEIDENPADKSVGWTSMQHPFRPDFSGSNFVYGSYLIFALRVDRKIISPKMLKKHVIKETDKRLRASGRDFLSRSEQKIITDHVVNRLILRMPSTPFIYDVIWNVEESQVWFFSNLKSANEDLQALFLRSFNLTLMRLFPYTAAYVAASLTDGEKDVLESLQPAKFAR